LALVTARGLNLPDSMKGLLDGTESKITCTWPAITSFIAGALPL